MANKKVVASFEIVAKGKNISVVAKDTARLGKEVEKTARNTKQANKTAKDYDKQNKSLFQGNLSSAKAFSKMNQTIGSGSSGLVGAYATLAANVFAATAAFSALRSAAQVEQLAQGFDFLAAQVGRSGAQISAQLREITQGALSFEEATRASAVALTAGFSTDSIERLGQVSRNASVGLGRNLADSTDRLFRGVAKLEPEILDELGILVRLDTATENYGASIGKAASDLSDFERRQAFLNAAIEQGELKFGLLGDAVEVNPYDELAASFADLTKQIITIANTAVGPLIKLLASNTTLLLGTLVMFGSTIVGQMFPALTELGKKSLEAAEKAKIAAQMEQDAAEKTLAAKKKLVVQSNLGGAGVQQLRNQLAQNKAVKNFDKAIGSLSKSEKLRERNLKNFHGAELERKKKELQQIKQLKAEVLQLKAAEQGRAAAQVKAKIADAQSRESARTGVGVATIGTQGGLEGFKTASKELGRLRVDIARTEKLQGNLIGKSGQRKYKSFSAAAVASFRLASGGARLFGAALINAIPLIGQIIFAVGLLVEGIVAFAGRQKEAATGSKALEEGLDALDAKLEKFNEGTEATIEKLREFNDNFSETDATAVRLAKSTEFAAGGMDTLNTSFQQALQELNEENVSRLDIALMNIGNSFRELGKAIAESGVGKFFGSIIQGGIEGLKQLGSALASGAANVVDFLITPTDVEAIEAVKEARLDKVISDTQTQLSALTGESVVLQKIAADAIGEGGITGLVNTLQSQGLSTAEIQKELSEVMNTVAKNIADAQGEAKSLTDGTKELDKQLSKFLTKLAKKNEFEVFANSIRNIENGFKNTIKQTGDFGTALEQFRGNLSGEQLATLEKFGIKLEDIFTGVVKNADGEIVGLEGTLTELGQTFTNIAEQERAVPLLKESTKNAIAYEKAILKSTLAQNDLNAKLTTLKKTGAFELTPEQVVSAAKERAKLTKAAAEEEFKLKTTLIEAEYDLLREKVRVDKNLTEDQKTAQIARLDLIEKTGLAEAKSARDVAVAGADSTLQATLAAAGQTGTTAERIGAVGRAGTFEDGSTAQKITALSGMLAPMQEQLAALGPEGQFVSQATTGILSVAQAFNVMAEEGITSAKGLEAAGAAIGAISQVMAAQTNAQVAEIDKQIEAEKKRDGKSAESLAKIQAMEKKKEAIQRKAFNQQKKLQMAQTVINTAAAITKALTELPFPANVALSVMMGALGAAQLAIIAKSKFEGASSGDVKPPSTNLSIGGRSNAVDVSRRPTGGELNYLRGGATTGQNLGGAGASFQGGAMGRKSYSEGGIVVGERGPEIISASSDIDVTPNYALGGGTMNVNFSISALDSAGVEDVLMNQQGNIIKMIRQAANQNGENFLENVDTMAYGSSGGDT